MKIKLLHMQGIEPALIGVGLSYGLTSEYSYLHCMSEEKRNRLVQIAGNLAKKGGGEDKFLRQIICWWDVKAPRFWWCEADTYKVATTAQSESTMHTIMHRELTQEDFEYEIPVFLLGQLNELIEGYRETKDKNAFIKLKNMLPEGFLQRRVWSLSLANMKNIYAQRKNHRLPQWHQVCQAFVEETPIWLRGIYGEN